MVLINAPFGCGMQKACWLCSQLAGCPFSALTPSELSELAAYKQSLSFRKNTIVYSHGVRADSVYVLCQGSVKLVWCTNRGDQRIVGFIKPGEMFGLDSLLPDSTRPFTAVTRTSCEVVCFDRKDFSRVLRSKPHFLWRFAAILNLALQESQRARMLLSGDRARTRLANALQLCTSVGDLKEVELAEILGISSETVSRKLQNPETKSMARRTPRPTSQYNSRTNVSASNSKNEPNTVKPIVMTKIKKCG